MHLKDLVVEFSKKKKKDLVVVDLDWLTPSLSVGCYWPINILVIVLTDCHPPILTTN